MKARYTDSFKYDYKNLPIQTQEQINKQIRLLLKNPHHPSLHTKKMEGEKGKKGIWEGRITKGIRFSFKIEKDTYILRRVGPHNKVLKQP
ncbi:MAG: hypothetical protein AB1422_07225 [bacterium]